MVLINLASARLLDAAAGLPEKLLVPPEVVEETVGTGERLGYAEAFLLRKALGTGGFQVATAAGRRLVGRLMQEGRLRRTDASVIATAIEQRALVASDDAKVRRAAEREGLSLGGTGYVLARLVKTGKLARRDAKRSLDAMVESGWYCDVETYSKILRQLGL